MRPTRSIAVRGVSPVMGTLACAWTLVRRRARAGLATASTPSSTMRPEVGRNRPTTWLARVVLPAPLCPRRPTTSPAPTVMVIPALAWTMCEPLPKCLWRSSMVSTSAMDPFPFGVVSGIEGMRSTIDSYRSVWTKPYDTFLLLTSKHNDAVSIPNGMETASVCGQRGQPLPSGVTPAGGCASARRLRRPR